MTAVLLKAEHLVRRLPGEVPVTLVNDASVEIGAGEFVAITGPSGSGKSSLLYLLGLLDRPTSGRILLNGVDVSEYDDDRLAAVRLAELGFVFQANFLLPEFTALENVQLPMRKLGKLDSAGQVRRGRELLARLGLEDHFDKRPNQLSGGQSQRVAIARALANDPILVLADEPTGNLDTHASANVQAILRDLVKDRARSVVVVTHDPKFAASADRIIRIVDGTVQAS